MKLTFFLLVHKNSVLVTRINDYYVDKIGEFIFSCDLFNHFHVHVIHNKRKERRIVVVSTLRRWQVLSL